VFIIYVIWRYLYVQFYKTSTCNVVDSIDLLLLQSDISTATHCTVFIGITYPVCKSIK